MPKLQQLGGWPLRPSLWLGARGPCDPLSPQGQARRGPHRHRGEPLHRDEVSRWVCSPPWGRTSHPAPPGVPVPFGHCGSPATLVTSGTSFHPQQTPFASCEVGMRAPGHWPFVRRAMPRAGRRPASGRREGVRLSGAPGRSARFGGTRRCRAGFVIVKDGLRGLAGMEDGGGRCQALRAAQKLQVARA